MKKCDIKGCKEKATVFMKTLCFCSKHHKEIFITLKYKSVGE